MFVSLFLVRVLLLKPLEFDTLLRFFRQHELELFWFTFEEKSQQ